MSSPPTEGKKWRPRGGAKLGLGHTAGVCRAEVWTRLRGSENPRSQLPWPLPSGQDQWALLLLKAGIVDHTQVGQAEVSPEQGLGQWDSTDTASTGAASTGVPHAGVTSTAGWRSGASTGVARTGVTHTRVTGAGEQH